jgi:putative heme-binding domain-containing protein
MLAGPLFQRAGTRVEILAQYEGAASLAGTPERGAALFDKNCAQCHAFRGSGHAVGPNLVEFAGKSAQDFLVAILDPNSAINPGYLAYNLETKDDRSLSGVVKGETGSSLTLVQGGGMEETILRNDIAEIRASQLSLMPEGLEQAMTPQDIADLIAWLKKSAPAPFGSASGEQMEKARAEFRKREPNGVAK